MSWILTAILLVVFGFVLLSPLESLRWWSSKGEEEVRATFEELSDAELPPVRHKGQFAVFLSGIGTLSGTELTKRETAFVEALREELPDLVVVDDVFPYAVDNRGLNQRVGMRIWKWLDRMRRRWPLSPLPYLIQVRNVGHVLVSADPRYGPTYSIGLAQEIWRGLQRRGYRAGSGDPVIIIGYSGGGQVGLGAAWFLAGVGVPVSMISIGGVFGDDPGLDRLDHLWDLYGTRDSVRYLGPIAFPGRWPTAPLSRWARAKREGRVTPIEIGTMKHDGPDAYFGRRKFGADGRPHADATREAVAAILREQAGQSAA
ncbi:MAG: hypothetical protein IPJ61_08885 [Tessaracoccus sp.]|uniref:hypothetical protein n=1 Tax=Tessaracoccus sp. TaxID=1971211 RepID=UPI001EBC985C|nr:hypothetical protein [Tessaracoccus sp.]MBK7821175.1 hypothetical protein [Tessaracoccus sp.]